MGKRSGISLCYPFEERRLYSDNPRMIQWKLNSVLGAAIQPKLDGERCRAEWSFEFGRYFLYSSEVNIFYSVPHINAMLTARFGWFNSPPHLDGELYRHGWSFEKIHSVVSRQENNLHPEFTEINFHIFDIVQDLPQLYRFQTLKSLDLETSNHHDRDNIVFVHPSKVTNVEEIFRYQQIYAQLGYEGFVLRHYLAPYVKKRTPYMMKFKPKQDDYYEIVDTVEECTIDGKPKGRLGRFVCKGDDGTLFAVYSGIPDHLREEYWKIRETLPGNLLHVGYQHITEANGVPRHGCFLNLKLLKSKGGDESVEE
jgi:ATP-dependent DNA ligase